jgi:flagellar biosynthesis protein
MSDKRFIDLRKQTERRPAAAALAYDRESRRAPEIIAAGYGLRAEEITALARKHNIPLYEDARLVEALAKLDVGTVIPSELWEVVATVLAFIYRVDAQSGT